MDTDWRARIGAMVANERKSRGWTYRDLQHHCGVAASHLHKIEHGQVDPSVSVMQAIAVSFGVSLNQVCGIEPVESETAKLQQQLAVLRTRIERAHLALFGPMAVNTCPHDDPYCPCQDGDPCNHEEIIAP